MKRFFVYILVFMLICGCSIKDKDANKEIVNNSSSCDEIVVLPNYKGMSLGLYDNGFEFYMYKLWPGFSDAAKVMNCNVVYLQEIDDFSKRSQEETDAGIDVLLDNSLKGYAYSKSYDVVTAEKYFYTGMRPLSVSDVEVYAYEHVYYYPNRVDVALSVGEYICSNYSERLCVGLVYNGGGESENVDGITALEELLFENDFDVKLFEHNNDYSLTKFYEFDFRNVDIIICTDEKALDAILSCDIDGIVICQEITEQTCKYLIDGKVEMIADIPYYEIGFDIAVQVAKCCNGENYDKEIAWMPMLINDANIAKSYMKYLT